MSLSDILQIERERVRRERVVLDTVYDRLNNRINNSVRANAKTCVYVIPEMIPGYPLVNLTKTMLFLLKKLKKEGFIAFPLSETHLFVTWDPKEIRKLDLLTRQHTVPSYTEQQKIAERDNDDFITSLIRSKQEDNKN